MYILSYWLDVLVAWGEIAAAYLILKYVRRKYVGFVTTAFTMGYLTLVHIERMINDYGGWHLGISTFVMLLCIRLSSIAWDYVDGKTDPDKLSSVQKIYALREIPSLLEYFACSVSPTEALAGPLCNFADFRDYIYMQGIYKNVPSTILPCFKRFGTGIILVAFYVLISNWFPLSGLIHPDFYKRNFFMKVS